MKGRTSGLEDFTILDPSLNHHHRHRRHPIYQVITWVECADERSLGSFPACQRLPSPSSCRASGRAQPSFGLSSTVFFASASIQGPSRRFGLQMRPPKSDPRRRQQGTSAVCTHLQPSPMVVPASMIALGLRRSPCQNQTCLLGWRWAKPGGQSPVVCFSEAWPCHCDWREHPGPAYGRHGDLSPPNDSHYTVSMHAKQILRHEKYHGVGGSRSYGNARARWSAALGLHPLDLLVGGGVVRNKTGEAVTWANCEHRTANASPTFRTR